MESETESIIIYPEDRTERIKSCSICIGRERLPTLNTAERRKTRCSDTNHNSPRLTTGVKTVCLGEAPPETGRHVYDLNSPLSTEANSLAWRVWKNLALRDELDVGESIDDLESISKPEFLESLRAKGIVVIDCSQCSIPKRDKKDRKENRTMLHTCFAKHTLPVLKSLSELNETIQIRPVYNSARRVLSSKVSRKAGLIDTWTFGKKRTLAEKLG